ncbi:unnamed protein product [Ceutorhynchus assimilis]|uniref:Branched-chain-amino-acid aminotransferase n=1 Tax=Ceutorhynchus assimilis TaxID=467358 RepID=A0A9N9MTR6_9CUCU|nr:unnamed protein product [Ceutorhynchus assimilis]
MFSSTKQCSCKLLFQFQHKLRQSSKNASRSCSLKVKQILSEPLEEKKYEPEQYDETDSEITFRFKDLTTKLCNPDQLRAKPDEADLKFGHIFTDHMLKVFYHRKLGGWQKPVIIPFENISLHPASKVLHYAIELFEGMKVYRGVDGKIRIFRPELNMARMNASAISSGLPSFYGDELIKCIKRLVEVDQEWVPHSPTSSLYMRPTLIGIDGTLGVQQSESALLFTIMCPVGSYFSGSDDSVSLLADPAYTRAWPGGCGDKKLGSNYGPTIRVQKRALEKGRQQVLWLYGPDHQITEVGTMNIFVFYEDEFGERVLATPPLNGLILPGVTRQSILQLCDQWKEFRIEQRAVTMSEIVQRSRSGKLLEMFGAGTACIISPIRSIEYQDELIEVPTMQQQNPVYHRARAELVAIQYGHIQHPWAQVIE